MSLHTKVIRIALVSFLKFFLIGGKLFYHFLLLSTIQCKLAIIIYIYIYCISLAS